jgi:hypothetical protein
LILSSLPFLFGKTQFFLAPGDVAILLTSTYGEMVVGRLRYKGAIGHDALDPPNDRLRTQDENSRRTHGDQTQPPGPFDICEWIKLQRHVTPSAIGLRHIMWSGREEALFAS